MGSRRIAARWAGIVDDVLVVGVVGVVWRAGSVWGDGDGGGAVRGVVGGGRTWTSVVRCCGWYFVMGRGGTDVDVRRTVLWLILCDGEGRDGRGRPLYGAVVDTL